MIFTPAIFLPDCGHYHVGSWTPQKLNGADGTLSVYHAMLLERVNNTKHGTVLNHTTAELLYWQIKNNGVKAINELEYPTV